MTKFGRYELKEELGKGGFGTVYKAEDQVLGRIVALKVLHPALVIEPTFLERFKQEARIAARLDHPNLVQVFDFGEVEGNFFITMAYMPGGSLRDLLSRDGKLTTERAMQIFQQTAAGLTYAHNKNVIHRDLKPGNILLDDIGSARLSDLGFAKVLTNPSSMTMSVSGGLIGTPAYMAPELWLDQKATKQTDQYSLACILVEMLTGTPLFDGESTPGIMTKHFQPFKLPVEVDESLRYGLERALQQKPEDRWNTIEDFYVSVIEADQTGEIKDIEQRLTGEIINPANKEDEQNLLSEQSERKTETFKVSKHEVQIIPTVTPVASKIGNSPTETSTNNINSPKKQNFNTVSQQFYLNQPPPYILDSDQKTDSLPLEPYDGDPSIWGNYFSNPLREEDIRGKKEDTIDVGLQAIYVFVVFIIIIFVILIIFFSNL